MRGTFPRLFEGGALLVLSAACTGQVGDPPPGDGTSVGGAGSGVAGSGVAGSIGQAGAGATSGGGGLPGQAMDSGSNVLRRLNRTEYNNTVRDLLGTSLRPADKLPNDETSEGFDTIGEALGLSLQHVEVLEQAATQLIDELYALPAGDVRRRAVLACELQSGAEQACGQQILSSFARRAFRRPVAETEITRMLGLVEKLRSAGHTYEESLQATLRSILLSPHVLYMVEKAPAGGPGAVAPVNDHELATRLSYFLWSSMPDAPLFAAAEAGLAGDSAKLASEVQRMLQDPKAAALTENFVGQWLTLRRLPLVEPDKNTFPGYDVALRDAAGRETQLLFRSLLTENAPIETLVTANFTFANTRLGQHYGTPVAGSEFQRVDLSGTERVGILSHASFLMMNAHPAWTSPTKRGAWVLEQLLCSPPPPVPSDLMIDPLTAPASGETVREKLAAHRADDRCAGCHTLMDPIGLALENFDSIGGYRTMDNGSPVDASGVLQGTSFSGVRELSALLGPDARLSTCFTQQLLTYAVGRSFHTRFGHDYAVTLVEKAKAAGRRGTRDLIESVVQSEAFRTRRGE